MTSIVLITTECIIVSIPVFAGYFLTQAEYTNNKGVLVPDAVKLERPLRLLSTAGEAVCTIILAPSAEDESDSLRIPDGALRKVLERVVPYATLGIQNRVLTAMEDAVAEQDATIGGSASASTEVERKILNTTFFARVECEFTAELEPGSVALVEDVVGNAFLRPLEEQATRLIREEMGGRLQKGTPVSTRTASATVRPIKPFVEAVRTALRGFGS
jgi:hypothetical protein